ncbi:hypothetical protein [Patiriisocius hiemis]|uniref:Uncharacterized protein n=1 Tax=Patiriisocius hiemis TaxID=3075604 RepID=A0ABU2YEN2_9FLAO|nr:hypothetical protein [Constantimarinum sp. W242]MDT0555508.1 hypothetical protein [Constantimarinum sp. W242]
MEIYSTKNDSKNLVITVIPSSDAKLDDPNEVIVIIHQKEDARRRKRQAVTINAEGNYEAEVLKSKLVEKPIVKIITSFIVDANQFPNKDIIVAQTEIDYSFNGGQVQGFETKYDTHKDEYNKGSDADETFRVTKRIEVLLT